MRRLINSSIYLVFVSSQGRENIVNDALRLNSYPLMDVSMFFPPSYANKPEEISRKISATLCILNDCWYRPTSMKHHHIFSFLAFVCLYAFACMASAQAALPNDIVKESFFVCNTSPWWTEENMFALTNFYCLYLMDYINALEWMKNVVCDTKNFFSPLFPVLHTSRS